MTEAKYATAEYRAAYAAIRKAQRAGRWLVCMQPVCVMTTRDIAPTQHADVAHDDSGTIILGAAHSRCNRRDGAVRGNRMRGAVRRSWVL